MILLKLLLSLSEVQSQATVSLIWPGTRIFLLTVFRDKALIGRLPRQVKARAGAYLPHTQHPVYITPVFRADCTETCLPT
jgi:hypothetical protein